MIGTVCSYKLLSLLLLILCNLKINAEEYGKLPTNFAYQSGPDYGSSYGSSIQIDSDNDRFFITGSTYGSFWSGNAGDNDEYASSSEPSTSSSCFLAIYNWKFNRWTKKTFHANNYNDDSSENKRNVNEACHKIILLNNSSNNTTKIFLLGYTEPNGILKNLHLSSTYNEKQYGMLLDIDVIDNISAVSIDNVTSTTMETSIELIGGRILQDGLAQYPIDMTMVPADIIDGVEEEAIEFDDGGLSNDLVIVSLQSFDPTTKALIDQEEPDFNHKRNFMYGSIYSLLVERFFYDNEYEDSTQIKETFVDTWRELYGSENMENNIDVVGIISYEGDIIVIGNTAETGYIYGEPNAGTIELDVDATHADTTDTFKPLLKNIDGFVSRLSQETGRPIDTEKKLSLRIESVDYQNDTITGYCHYGDDLYLVGTTKGQLSSSTNDFVRGEIHAFVIAVDLISLSINWIKQIGGKAISNDIVHGVTCSVSPADNGNVLYWGGNIYNNGSLSLYNQQSNGGNDIFIIQLATSNGRMNYIKQWGTLYDDILSDIQTDEYGNAVVMGTTNGSFIRSKQTVNTQETFSYKDLNSEEAGKSDTFEDIFIFSLDRSNGKISHLEPMNHYMGSAEGGSSKIVESIIDDGIDVASERNVTGLERGNSSLAINTKETSENITSSNEDVIAIEDTDKAKSSNYEDKNVSGIVDSNHEPERSNVTRFDGSNSTDTANTEEVEEDGVNNKDDSAGKENDEAESSMYEDERSNSTDNRVPDIENIIENAHYEDERRNGTDNGIPDIKNIIENAHFEDERRNGTDNGIPDIESIIEKVLNNISNILPPMETVSNESEVDDEGKENVNVNENEEDSNITLSLGKSMTKIAIFSFILFVVGSIMMLFVYNTRRYWFKKVGSDYDIPTDRSKITDYLVDFDADDVDLKHSATGGWHCSYGNDLAEGINTCDPGVGLFPGWNRPPPTSTPVLGVSSSGGFGSAPGGFLTSLSENDRTIDEDSEDGRFDRLMARDEHIDQLFTSEHSCYSNITPWTVTTKTLRNESNRLLRKQSDDSSHSDNNNYLSKTRYSDVNIKKQKGDII